MQKSGRIFVHELGKWCCLSSENQLGICRYNVKMPLCSTMILEAKWAYKNINISFFVTALSFSILLCHQEIRSVLLVSDVLELELFPFTPVHWCHLFENTCPTWSSTEVSFSCSLLIFLFRMCILSKRGLAAPLKLSCISIKSAAAWPR